MTTEQFITRIELLLKHFNLSPSAFADKIGVQRSGISHLLSGRNKPSLDFILKILSAFPEVDIYWILTGHGNFLLSEKSFTGDLSKVEDQSSKENGRNTKIKSAKKAMHDAGTDKIVILREDGTFMEYVRGKEN